MIDFIAPCRETFHLYSLTTTQPVLWLFRVRIRSRRHHAEKKEAEFQIKASPNWEFGNEK